MTFEMVVTMVRIPVSQLFSFFSPLFSDSIAGASAAVSYQTTRSLYLLLVAKVDQRTCAYGHTRVANYMRSL